MAQKARTFYCKSCYFTLNSPLDALAGEELTCSECGTVQSIPTEAEAAARRAEATPRGPRYPTLASLSGVYQGVGVLLGICGLVIGLLVLGSGGAEAWASGFTVVAFGLLGCVSLLGASEGVKWMIDVEDHLRAMRSRS